MGKSVAKKEATNAVVFSDERPDFLKNSNRGSDDVGIDDLTIPRIEVIQDLSPQRKKNQPEYIEGADTGMVFNTVSGELYPDASTEGVLAIPVHFRSEFVVWRDRDAGGGFCGAFPTEAAAVAAIQSGEIDSPNQLTVDKTHQHFVLVMSASGMWEEAVISMAKSKLKASRQWNSLIRMGGGDRFSRVYRLNTVEVDGGKGSYQNWKVSNVGFVTEEAYKQAENLYDAVASGERDIERGGESKGESHAEGDTIG